MYEVIVSTRATGTVRRRLFGSWDRARRWADGFDQGRYRVELCRRTAEQIIHKVA